MLVLKLLIVLAKDEWRDPMISSRIDELYLLTGLLKFMLRVMGIGITAWNPQSEFVFSGYSI